MNLGVELWDFITVELDQFIKWHTSTNVSCPMFCLNQNDQSPFFPLLRCSLPNKMFFNLWARRQIPLSVLHLYCRMLNCGRCIFLSYWLVLCTDSSEKMPFWDPFDIGRKMTTFKRVATAVSLEKQREVKNNFLLRCAAHCYLAALQLWLVMNHAT